MHVKIVVTHGFHVDNTADGPREEWCGYCAITLVKFSENGKVERLLNAYDDHISIKR